MKILVFSFYVFMFFIASSVTTIANVTDPTNPLRVRAEAALVSNDPALAIELATKLLDLNETDASALILLSLAYTSLNQHANAARAATKAFHATTLSKDKLQSARLVGGAKFKMGQFTRAEWWLRVAANHAKTADAKAMVGQEFQAIRQQNPLSIQLSFSAAPSSNINGGSEDAFFYLGDQKFLFSPDRLALSGIEFSGDVNVSYRLSQSKNHNTSLGAYLYGRTYSLSSESQATVTNISGSDYALTLAEVSLSHRQILFDGLGPTGVSFHTGQIWYGGSPLWRHNRIAFSQDFLINQKSSATIQAFVERQTALDQNQSDAKLYNLKGIYARRLPNNDILRISSGLTVNDAIKETYAYRSYNAAVTYQIHKPVLDMGVSFSLSVGTKQYDEFSLSLNGRRDDYVAAGASFVFQKLSYFGFSPNLSISASKTKSNVSQFSNIKVQGRLGIQSTF
jgi:hypothetical protein